MDDAIGFRADVLSGMTAQELAKKYGVSKRTVFYWKARLRESGKLPQQRGQLPSNLQEWEEEGNYGEAISVSPTIRSVDQLVDACGIDLNDWTIIESGHKKWDVGAKLKTGKLKWKDGHIVEGNLEYGGIGVQDLWSVWLRLRKKDLTPITPTIQPVSCPVTFRPTAKARTGAVMSSLIWTDPQFGYLWEKGRLVPFHDREVLDLWLQAAAMLQPDRIDILGDWFDVPGFSVFLQDPSTYNTFQPAILEAHWWLRQFREACPNTEIRIHPGNHDERIRKALLKHLPVAYGLHAADEMDLPPQLHPARLLALHKLGIEWLPEYPNDEDWLGESVRLNHGYLHRTKAGATTKAMLAANDVSTITGHGHRSEHISKTIRFRRRTVSVSAYAVGCTCRTDGVVPSRHKYMDWQQSAALVNYTDAGHTFSAIHVDPESPKEAIAGDVLFTARDRTEDLRKDLPEHPW